VPGKNDLKKGSKELLCHECKAEHQERIMRTKRRGGKIQNARKVKVLDQKREKKLAERKVGNYQKLKRKEDTQFDHLGGKKT